MSGWPLALQRISQPQYLLHCYYVTVVSFAHIILVSGPNVGFIGRNFLPFSLCLSCPACLPFRQRCTCTCLTLTSYFGENSGERRNFRLTDLPLSVRTFSLGCAATSIDLQTFAADFQFHTHTSRTHFYRPDLGHSQSLQTHRISIFYSYGRRIVDDLTAHSAAQ